MFRSLIFAFATLISLPAMAESTIISAPEAAVAVNNGEMILVDIRSPGEWAETGVAKGAVAMTLHSPDFSKQIGALLTAEHGKSIGLICATGGRTAYVINILSKNGFDNVVDVSEGMIGNERGPGWIKRGMPLVTADVAQRAYQLLALQP